MKILVIGSGGREHALADTYSKSGRVAKVFVAPGNDFMEETSSKIRSIPHLTYLNRQEILSTISKERIDFVDVAGDEPLAHGLVDFLSENGIPSFGPTKASAELEWNKVWSRTIMEKYKLPIPEFNKFADEKSALRFLKNTKNKLLFIKASGLAAGKGAIKAETQKEAIEAVKQMKKFGSAGKEFLIEEGMSGTEFSLFVICDGKRYVVLNAAQDHKTVYENGQGPNTGGMGCVSPVSLISSSLISNVKKTILNPLLHGISLEDRPYSGVLYLGGMLTKKGVRIIEFNARWGDPEAEVILPSIKTDYTRIVEAALMQELMTTKINFDKMVRVSVTACAQGYPGDYNKVMGKKVFGLKKAAKIKGVKIFGAGLKRKNKDYIVNGGRIAHIVGEGGDIEEARARAYEAMSYLYVEGNNLHFRTDIGFNEVEKSL